METSADDDRVISSIVGAESHQNIETVELLVDRESASPPPFPSSAPPSSSLSSSSRPTFLLENVGDVVVSIDSDGLSWELLDSSLKESTCLGIKLGPKFATGVDFADVYGVELLDNGLIGGANQLEMLGFTVHGLEKSRANPCLWILAMYTFRHKDLQTCQIWVDRINDSLKSEVERPKRLLVFVHPLSGKGKGCKTWETVAPIFACAKVNAKVVVTKRAGQAFDEMSSATDEELNSYDGVIAIGGDGFFNEILNGFLLSRHKAPHPPSPLDFVNPDQSNGHSSVHGPNNMGTETSNNNEDHYPLLSNSHSESANFGAEDGSSDTGYQPLDPLRSERFRFGIIPAGSTDAIVMCTTGTRDPITSALQIVLGKRVHLDIAQVVRWKVQSSSKIEPCVRYAASFAGYGFYGDVIKESEKYRWMGPKRYDYAGTKIFLEHRSYEAEVAYIETEAEKTSSAGDRGHLLNRGRSIFSPSERVICRKNCGVCCTKSLQSSKKNYRPSPYPHPEETRWRRSKGNFLSVGAAVISNRNERAPDGLVADAHLSDGFLHLLLIRDCPRALYLWHLTQLARRGGKPLNFNFVEHHKTPAFTFTSHGKESVWNLDGELFPAHQLSAQVFRGLISLFASGPEI